MQGNERMQKSYMGGCLCGAVRYELIGVPERLYACHCKECQRQSGSAFDMPYWLKRVASKYWENPMDDASPKTRG